VERWPPSIPSQLQGTLGLCSESAQRAVVAPGFDVYCPATRCPGHRAVVIVRDLGAVQPCGRGGGDSHYRHPSVAGFQFAVMRPVAVSVQYQFRPLGFDKRLQGRCISESLAPFLGARQWLVMEI